VDERPINEAWPSKSKKESKDKTVFLSPPVKVTQGITVTKIPRQAYKTRDITGGLPRIAELFEARRPKDPATISEVDGVVKFGEIKRGKREIYVYPVLDPKAKGDPEPPQLYEVASGKHLRVHEGDRVRAGDRLTEGPVNPHDILRIKGPRAGTGVSAERGAGGLPPAGCAISDKHIGVIVRQMLRRCGSPIRATPTSSKARRWTAHLPGGERPDDQEEGHSGAVGAGPARHHQGQSHDAVVHLGGVIPGDNAGLTDAAIRGAKDDLLA
jgi:DNA-directed RNA polymerase subunit beta'